MKVFYSFFFCLLTSIGLAQISIKEDIYVYISSIDFEGLSTKETIEELEYKKSSFTKGAENVKKYKDAQKNRYKERLAYPLSEYEPRYVSHPIITEIEYYKETYDLILENLAFEEVFESNKTKILLVDEVDYKDRHQKFNKNEKLSQSYIINIREISTKEKTIKADSISEITNIENVKIDYQFYHPQKIKTIEVNFDKSQIVNNEYFNYERIADGFLVDIKQKKINSLIDIKAYDKDGQEIEINAISSNIFTDKRLEETIIAYNIFFDELIGFVKSGATLDQLIEKSKTGKV
ncbi:MAG TPA: hypothetical protein VLZ72_03485, partial [Flavobacterium sp.]|nr:hypothetical protein [Flavobacterium sp.]